MLLTVERPSGWATAIRAWQSLFAGLRAFWPLFLGCVVLSIAWGFALQWQTRHLPVSSLAGAHRYWLLIGHQIFVAFVRSLIAAPVAVAMHRFILLGETRPQPFAKPGVTLHFAAWLTVLRLPTLLTALSPLLLPLMSLATYGVTIAVVGLGLTVLMLWLTLLFPAIAVEDPATGAARLETALERIAGNFWLVLWAMVIAFLPISVLTVFTPFMTSRAIEAGMRNHHTTQDVMAHMMPWLLTFNICIATLSAGLAAAVASWIYSYAVTRPRAGV